MDAGFQMQNVHAGSGESMLLMRYAHGYRFPPLDYATWIVGEHIIAVNGA